MPKSYKSILKPQQSLSMLKKYVIKLWKYNKNPLIPIILINPNLLKFNVTKSNSKKMESITCLLLKKTYLSLMVHSLFHKSVHLTSILTELQLQVSSEYKYKFFIFIFSYDFIYSIFTDLIY